MHCFSTWAAIHGSQQCGRAGRDSKPSSATVFMDITREETKLKYMMEGSLERKKCSGISVRIVSRLMNL